MNEYTTLFTEKYLNDKFSFNTFEIPEFENRIAVIQRWAKEVNDRTIYNKKEEQLQADFLNDIFGKVLGYAYERGLDEYNLEKEEKSKTDGTKPDGILGYFNAQSKDIRVVIELKDAYTNLEHKQNRKNDKRTPIEQAFSYVAKSGGNCKWVIVSNFVEIRLYPANDSSIYQQFMVRDLVKPDVFKTFYALLAKNHLFLPTTESVVDKLLQHKIEADTQITKDFYNDYKKCRSALFHHIKENNPNVDDNLVLTKSQKILDRIIFICFCEDIGLLPYKVFKIILEEAKNSRFDVRETKLWERTKALFSMIDKGYPSENINRFNGGLFKDDEVIDNFIIKDSVLADIISLEGYDFESDLNVNILGHIFEQSITDLEELKASFNGEEVDKKKGKRKKDGIFYTPEYITKYIVREAVGGWLEDKKHELGYDELPKIDDEQWIRIRQGNIRRDNQTIKKHLDFWKKYRDALNNIKVLDPACGSGSFLVQVFDYLKEQSRLVNEEIAVLQGVQPDLFNLDSHILSHNIYGVDLNAESVEITKLALWLKTANKNDPLTSLDNNIKCGNSLVDDATIDSEHAFDWNKEFPDIMNNGGFDVVVGNPPYVLCQKSNTDEKILRHYQDKYVVSCYKIDLYHLFFEQSLNIANNNSFIGFITPNTYFKNKFLKGLRKFLLDNTKIIEIVNHDNNVFIDASVDVATIILKKTTIKEDNVIEFYDDFGSNNIVLSSSIKQKEIISNSLFEFCVNDTFSLNNIIDLEELCDCYFGIQAYDRKDAVSNVAVSTNFLPMIDGADIKRMSYATPNKYFDFRQEKIKSGGDYSVYKRERIVIRQIGITPVVGMCLPGILTSNTLYNVYTRNENSNIYYILGILNSKVMKHYWLSKYYDKKQLFPKIKKYQINKLPIPNVPLKSQENLGSFVEVMLSKNKELQELSTKFINLLKGDFKDVVINSTLSNWYDLEWSGLLDALKKQKIILSGTLKDDWFDRFNRYVKEIKAIQNIINDTDKQIDAAVYKLYNLTEEEIKVIEEQS